MGQPQLKNVIATFPRLPDYQLKYQQKHEFQGQFVQRIKETPFANSLFYNNQPSIFIEKVQPQVVLRMLVDPRLNTMKLFPYEQILKIFQNCLSGLKQLKDRQYKYFGSISLEKIYYSKSSRTFKLVNPIFNLQTNYQQAKLNIKFSFLSPQQLLALSQNSFQAQSTFASDIFILGIVLLEVCTLTQSSQIYCPQTYNIFDLQIRNRFQKVSEYYPQQLVQTLQMCLEYDCQARISLEELLKRVKTLRQRQMQQTSGQNIQQGPIQKAQNIPVHNPQNLLSNSAQNIQSQNMYNNIQSPNSQNMRSYPPGYNNNGQQLNNGKASLFQTPKK